MDRDEYVLFIDETGTASPLDVHSSYYILAGCAVLESERIKLRQWADHIKFKYWGKTDVVFHSREIGRKENDFSVFGRAKLFHEFLADMEDYLSKYKFFTFCVIVDKVEAKAKNWNDKKIYKETSEALLKNFLCFLMSQNARGKIVIESATAEKDFYFYKALSSYLGNGIPRLHISHSQVKNTLTSISFVTKNNFDIEEQLADLLAFAAKCKYMDQQKVTYPKNTYEELLLRILKKRLASKTHLRNSQKPKYVKYLDSFEVFPKAQ